MAYYPDLTRYEYGMSYWPDEGEAWNVGWLEGGHPFEVGDIDQIFWLALLELCVTSQFHVMRDYHECDLCPPAVRSKRRASGTMIDVDGGRNRAR